MSHLLQMRGLKPSLQNRGIDTGYVASFTDAWIETPSVQNGACTRMSHLLQMRGLKRK